MLTRIAVRGFKSFAEPVVIDLVPGVNVVVGPNGSGKSNVVEAVLWALGEQRAARLRAGAMGDVLFSGGAGRGPAALAQVSLTLAPVGDDGTEIETTRRLTADGESRYRLSGTACRLMDVQEALAARGLGPDALAIVRQGQVESVCTARPADLRTVVDEAAGIAGAKRRRRRALRRLGQTRERIARAEDIHQELRAQTRRLERQARAAGRAAELDEAIRAARAELEQARIADALDDARTAESTRRLRADELAMARTARAEADAAAADAGRAAETAASGIDAASAALERMRRAAERVGTRAEVVAERLDTVREAAERAARARGRLRELEVADRRAAEAATATGASADLAERTREACEREAAEAEAAAVAARAVAEADARMRAADERERLAGVRRLEAVRAELARLDTIAEDAGAPLDLERHSRREEVASARAERHRARERDAATGVEEARAQAEATAERARAAAARAAAIRPPAVGDDGTLGSGLEVEDGAEAAVAAALGLLAEARPSNDLRGAVRSLADGAQTAAIPGNPLADEDAPGITAWSVVRSCPEAHADLLRRVLEAVRIVDDLAQVPAGVVGTYVTRDGIAFRGPDGSVARVGEEWAVRARHARLSAEAEQARATADDHGETVRLREATYLAAGARRRAAERAAARAAAALSAARATAARRAGDAAERATRADALRAEMGIVEASLAPVTPDPTGTSDALARAAADAERRLEAAAAAAEAARTTGREAWSAATAARAAAEEAASRLARARGLAGSAPRVDLGDVERAGAVLSRIAIAIGQRASTFARALDARRRAAAAAVEHAKTLDAVAGRARDAESEAAASAAGADALAGAAAERYAAIGGDADDIGRASSAATRAGEATAEIIARLEHLERSRASIGAVNELAESEREELAARESEIAQQTADLEAAAASLDARLAALEAAVADGFGATFDALAERFSESIGTLFPGGRGVLRQVDDDDGEPGLVIEVVPAGKRPRGLALLSGGERSLVALAFCLALARTRPAPVYLLDEVEAALDDVNLRRFLELVRSLSAETQFVLITHQQPTVEIADAIYGVTMRDGVSQLVSRRLDERVEGPARPFVRRRLRAVAGGGEG